MTLKELYNLTNFIVRTTKKGKPLSVSMFAEMYNRRQVDYFQELYKVYEGNISLCDSLRHFKVIKTEVDIAIVGSQYFNLPDDYFHISGLSYIDGTNYYPFDVVTKSQAVMRKTNFLTLPSITNPICYEFDNKLYLSPYSSLLSLYFTYLRYPNDVVLDYYLGVDGTLNILDVGDEHTWVTGDTDSNGDIRYSGGSVYVSATVEPEWSEEDSFRIINYILRDMGIILKDVSIYQYADMQKNES